MRLYLTRDKDKALVLSSRMLRKGKIRWDNPSSKDYEFINLPDYWFGDVKWEDTKPKEVQIMIHDFKRNNKGR